MSIYSWDLTASNNATADAGINWAEGQSPSTVNNSARAMMAALKAGMNDVAGVSALAGSGDTFALSLSQPMTTLTNAVVGFFATRANTAAVTLNVDGLGAKPLRLVSGVALTAGQIVNGAFYQCAYNPSTLEWLIVGKYALSNADFPAMAANTIKANLTAGSATPTDVTVAALADAIAPNSSITNAKLATMVDSTVKGNLSGGTANPSDVTLAALGAALIASGAVVGVPSGALAPFAMTTAPTGWLECAGTAVSRSTYATLFSAIGTTFGAGNGTTTFNIPDLRGEFIRGYDNGRGVDSARAFGSAQADALKAHTHTVSPAVYPGPSAYSGGATPYVPYTSTANGAAVAADSTGGTETRPRNIALVYCIKT